MGTPSNKEVASGLGDRHEKNVIQYTPTTQNLGEIIIIDSDESSSDVELTPDPPPPIITLDDSYDEDKNKPIAMSLDNENGTKETTGFPFSTNVEIASAFGDPRKKIVTYRPSANVSSAWEMASRCTSPSSIISSKPLFTQRKRWRSFTNHYSSSDPMFSRRFLNRNISDQNMMPHVSIRPMSASMAIHPYCKDNSPPPPAPSMTMPSYCKDNSPPPPAPSMKIQQSGFPSDCSQSPSLFWTQESLHFLKECITLSQTNSELLYELHHLQSKSRLWALSYSDYHALVKLHSVLVRK